MRVLLVTKGLDLGGIERIVADLATGLHDVGVDVEVALVNSRRDRLAPTIERAGVTVHRLAGSDAIGVDAARRIVRLVRHGHFDVVHVHGPLPSALVRLAAAASVRVVTTSHAPWHSLRTGTRVAWRLTARLDAATIAVSAVVAASLPRGASRRAVVIPHGIDPERISAASAEAEERRAGREDPHVVTVVAVASHRDVKNYPNLLRAFRVAVDAGAPARLVAVGDGPMLPDHAAIAEELGIGHLVRFVPATDHVLVDIAGADIFVVASDYEGQPIVVAEALALGVPVVATAVGRVPEMVDASVGRVVASRDPAALGGALAELAGSPELRAAMSCTARAHVLTRTLDDVVAAHLAVYREICPGTR
jgi:glycosyltransferase involved in cell wall biosynthesis